MNLVRGLIASVRVVAGFEVPYAYDRQDQLCVVGPGGWIDEDQGLLRITFSFNGAAQHFQLQETAYVLAALLNIGVARLDPPWQWGAVMPSSIAGNSPPGAWQRLVPVQKGDSDAPTARRF